ncbi:MAG: type II toxin-antitoxin system RelE/ParE family toxin [Acidobacteria bacterium]|nr:type II toxin-antitoxin system RelE/ParE family toxin [Acidobacteriota bacterium]
MFAIRYSPDAVRHLKRLSARQRAEVLDQIGLRLSHEPQSPSRNRKRLRPNALATWSLRLGELRVYYDVEAETVTVLAIGEKIRNQVWIDGRAVEL